MELGISGYTCVMSFFASSEKNGDLSNSSFARLDVYFISSHSFFKKSINFSIFSNLSLSLRRLSGLDDKISKAFSTAFS